MKVMVDTSVWVDFFNKKEISPPLQSLIQLIGSQHEVCLCPIIYQEILQGIRDDIFFNEVKSVLDDIEMITADWEIVINCAIDLYRSLRKKGLTIRKSNDCLIAAYAIFADVPLLHKDRDFDMIAKNEILKLY